MLELHIKGGKKGVKKCCFHNVLFLSTAANKKPGGVPGWVVGYEAGVIGIHRIDSYRLRDPSILVDVESRSPNRRAAIFQRLRSTRTQTG